MAKRDRFKERYGLSEEDASLLTAERDGAEHYEAAVGVYDAPKKIANWVMGELLRELKDCETSLAGCKMEPAHLAELVRMVESDEISGKIGKKIFPELFRTGKTPAQVVEEQGLSQISDTSELESVVDEVLAAHPDEVARYQGGEKKLTGFFVGQIMKRTKGQANPKLVNQLIAKKLG